MGLRSLTGRLPPLLRKPDLNQSGRLGYVLGGIGGRRGLWCSAAGNDSSADGPGLAKNADLWDGFGYIIVSQTICGQRCKAVGKGDTLM